MEEFLPALGVIIWVVLNILGVIGKKKKNDQQESIPETNTDREPARGFFEELREQMKSLENAAETISSVEQEPVSQPVEDYKSPGQEYESLADQIELTQYEPISSEILQSPYSNLEEGVIDPVHQSKFEHHGGQALQVATVKRTKRKNLFREVSPKEAFVYSLIFDRKYFDPF